jgi:hypothetical protein
MTKIIPAQPDSAQYGSAQPSVEDFKREFLENLFLIQGTNLEFGTLHDCSLALAYTVRQYMVGP